MRAFYLAYQGLPAIVPQSVGQKKSAKKVLQAVGQLPSWVGSIWAAAKFLVEMLYGAKVFPCLFVLLKGN